MENQADKVHALFREIMRNCREERRAKTKKTLRDLSKELGTGENYLSAVEHGRELPSLKVFLSYLLANGFTLTPLLSLRIGEKSSSASSEDKNRHKLSQIVYKLNSDQVEFLMEQAHYATKADLRVSKVKKKKSRR